MSEVCQVYVHQGKDKTVKFMFTTLQVSFKEFRQVLCNSLLLFIKTGLMNTMLLEINLCIQEVSSLSYLLFHFSPVKKAGKVKLQTKSAKSFVSCFEEIFSIGTLWERAVVHPRCFKKRSVGLQNLMFRKCYFQTQEKSLTLSCGLLNR